jgi:hypothetical protein
MELRGIYGMLADFLGGLTDLLISLLSIGVLVELLYGKGIFGVSVVENVIALVGKFGANGFVGLLALLLLLTIYKK